MNCMVEITSKEATPLVRTGQVKWFSAARGFGFLTCPEFDQDILLHANVLGEFGGRALPPGADVEFLVVIGDQGPKVTEIVSVKLGQTSDPELIPAEVQAIPLVPARVKWFNVSKGFGFAKAFRNPDDIFLHASVLNQFGQWDLKEGEAISVRPQKTERGWIAVDIRPWNENI